MVLRKCVQKLKKSTLFLSKIVDCFTKWGVNPWWFILLNVQSERSTKVDGLLNTTRYVCLSRFYHSGHMARMYGFPFEGGVSKCDVTSVSLVALSKIVAVGIEAKFFLTD